LLHCEDNYASALNFTKLSKLLRSYFGKGTILIPMDQDWLILLGNNVIADLKEDNEEHTELSREMLMGLCEGLYEVVSTEWGGGGLYLTVNEGLIKLDQLLYAIHSLRETIELGRITSIGVHLHFAWQLQLERFVYSISTSEKSAIKDVVGTNLELFKEEETLTTLETFFQLDCNVSETAKRLYIHRNTLLYRLDKIKQESGLDVKSFRDAVLMQLGLLLYKLTKKT
jgi:sugar diacid utilization regulator